MPSILSNLWGCNLWQRDVEHDAASAESELGTSWDDNTWETNTEALGTSEPAPSYSVEEWHEELVKDWPEIAAVIDASLYVSDQSVDAREYWQAHWIDRKNDTMQCFDFARYQLHVAGFDVTGYKPESTTYQVWREDTGINVNETVEAVRYLKQTLSRLVPVLVGILLVPYKARPNPDKTTNHFVVIVGMGADGTGHYFIYYDSGSTTIENKFYLKQSLQIEDEYGYHKAAQVRETL